MKDLHELLLVCVIIAMTAFGSYKLGEHNGEIAVQTEWDRDHANMVKAGEKLVQDHAIDIQRLKDENRLINQKTNYEHEIAIKAKDAALAAARADADRHGGLRIQGTCVRPAEAGTGTHTQGSGQRDEAFTTTVELPRRIQDGLWAIISRADAVVEQARSCQNWIRDHGFSDENPVDGIAPSQ